MGAKTSDDQCMTNECDKKENQDEIGWWNRPGVVIDLLEGVDENETLSDIMGVEHEDFSDLDEEE